MPWLGIPVELCRESDWVKAKDGSQPVKSWLMAVTGFPELLWLPGGPSWRMRTGWFGSLQKTQMPITKVLKIFFARQTVCVSFWLWNDVEVIFLSHCWFSAHADEIYMFYFPGGKAVFSCTSFAGTARVYSPLPSGNRWCQDEEWGGFKNQWNHPSLMPPVLAKQQYQFFLLLDL